MKFKINGLIWEIQFVRRADERLSSDGSECLGVTYFNDLKIFVDQSLSMELLRQTIIHELIHAFTFSFGVHLVANEDTEESVCDFMGAHLDEIHEVADRLVSGYEKEAK